MAPVTASWALAQTADGFFKLGRDTALAAYSDNLQPLTIEACERFGATLAISQFAQTKMEATLQKQSKAPVQKFLLLKIGYGSGGSIDRLSSSTEGVRFLCLASALISSRQTFDAATLLTDMILSTAEDKELSPAIYQLRDLLDILEPRLNRYGFLNEVSGYQTLIAASTTGLFTPSISVPRPEAIKSIVESFRELFRLGDADAQSIKITVGRFAPWIAAFSRMCVEVPPSIVGVHGQQIIEQPSSQIMICISEEPRFHNEVELEMKYVFGSICKVIECVVGTDDQRPRPILATGMVTLDTHAELLLRELDFCDGMGWRAFDQALPYAVHLVKSFFARTSNLSAYKFAGREARVFDNVRCFDPFPPESVIMDLMRAYLKRSESAPSVKVLELGSKITDLRLVQIWVNDHQSFLEDKPEQEFIRRLSYVVADLFALSLLMPNVSSDYADLDLWLLHIPRRELSEMFSSGEQWQLDIQTILQGSLDTDDNDLEEMTQVEPCINWALKLLGHPVSGQVENKQWVASSFRGQVVLLRMLLMDEIPQEGFACLSHFPGTLMLAKEKDRRVSWILSQDTKYVKTELEHTEQLTACLSPFRDQQVQWHLATKADHLDLGIGWTWNRNTQPPMCALVALMRSVSIGRCGHPKDRAAQTRPGTKMVILPPGSNRLSSNIGDDVLAVIYPLHMKEEIKPLALASIAWMDSDLSADCPRTIVNRGGCIDCLLDVCEIARCKYIIL